MRRLLIALLLAALTALGAACDDTADGILEDTQENVDDLDSELEEIDAG